MAEVTGSVSWTIIATFITALGALIGSIIASVIAYRGTKSAQRIAKENLSMTAELERIKFREKWIQNLREEMSKLGGLATTLDDSDSEHRTAHMQHFVKILLLMNPEDDDYIELQNMAIDLLNYWRDGDQKMNKEDFKPKDYVSVCQRILKREWTRLNLEIDKYKEEQK